MRIAETFEREKLAIGISAGAATVGKPKGLNGKNMAPRRAIYTKKEKESIDKRAGLRAGGPGSGRKPTGKTKEYKESYSKKFFTNTHEILTKGGYKKQGEEGGGSHHVYTKGNSTIITHGSGTWIHMKGGKQNWGMGENSLQKKVRN